MQLNDPTLLQTDAFIDGGWSAAASGDRFPVQDPATGETLAEVADCAGAEAERAVAAAAAAFAEFRKTTAKERARLLRKWFDLIMANRDDLAMILTREQGKPLAEAKGEVVSGANQVEWAAEEARRAYGDVVPGHLPGHAIHVTKEPVGVVAAVTPWNFPFSMITRKCAPALSVGCTIVLKPAQDTPLCALALAVLAERAGFPRGVINVLPCLNPAPVGDVLTTHPDVRKLSFTGSTPVGKALAAAAAGTMKKVSMELGGNAPFLIFDDAHVDAAVSGALGAKYRNAGQTCISANRYYVQDGIYDAFVEKFTAAVRQIRVNRGTEKEVDQGPLINVKALEKVDRLVADARAKGAEIAVGGTPHDLGLSFYSPTVVLGAKPDMAFAQEEIFGPVAPIYRFGDEAEGLALANSSRFGLASYFYSRDIGRIERVASGLEFGMVGINSTMIATEVAPFGGVKESGLGREGGYQGTEEFLETKLRSLGGLDD